MHGETTLHRAVKGGNEQKVLKLLKKGADVNACNSDGFTPVHFAVKYGHPNLIKILMEHGGDINRAGFHGLRPFHMLMVSRNRYNCLEEILKYKPEIDAREVLGNTILQIMVMIAPYNTDVIFKLLEHGSNPNNLNVVGNNCLHNVAMLDQSVSANRTRMLAGALIRKGLDVNAKNRAANTPLHFAARGNAALVGILLEKGADINAVNNENLTPFDLAVKSNKLPVFEQLIKYVVLRLDANLEVKQSIIDHISNSVMLSNIRQKYVHEMNVLKFLRVTENSKLSYHDLLCSEKDKRRIVRNIKAFGEISCSYIRYSSYKNEIFNNLNEEVAAQKTEDEAYSILSKMFWDKLPDLCIARIAFYLGAKDIQSLRSGLDESKFQ
ncbi:putative ankyrin repeat protein RF_0381 isoform X2 [Coccinella septempunctata]|nr:putative ankyrin repeat protein RF_0381 isoform X2 [Coccinella septempunctata]